MKLRTGLDEENLWFHRLGRVSRSESSNSWPPLDRSNFGFRRAMLRDSDRKSADESLEESVHSRVDAAPENLLQQ